MLGSQDRDFSSFLDQFARSNAMITLSEADLRNPQILNYIQANPDRQRKIIGFIKSGRSLILRIAPQNIPQLLEATIDRKDQYADLQNTIIQMQPVHVLKIAQQHLLDHQAYGKYAILINNELFLEKMGEIVKATLDGQSDEAILAILASCKQGNKENAVGIWLANADLLDRSVTSSIELHAYDAQTVLLMNIADEALIEHAQQALQNNDYKSYNAILTLLNIQFRPPTGGYPPSQEHQKLLDLSKNIMSLINNPNLQKDDLLNAAISGQHPFLLEAVAQNSQSYSEQQFNALIQHAIQTNDIKTILTLNFRAEDRVVQWVENCLQNKQLASALFIVCHKDTNPNILIKFHDMVRKQNPDTLNALAQYAMSSGNHKAFQLLNNKEVVNKLEDRILIQVINHLYKDKNYSLLYGFSRLLDSSRINSLKTQGLDINRLNLIEAARECLNNYTKETESTQKPKWIEDFMMLASHSVALGDYALKKQLIDLITQQDPNTLNDLVKNALASANNRRYEILKHIFDKMDPQLLKTLQLQACNQRNYNLIQMLPSFEHIQPEMLGEIIVEAYKLPQWHAMQHILSKINGEQKDRVHQLLQAKGLDIKVLTGNMPEAVFRKQSQTQSLQMNPNDLNNLRALQLEALLSGNQYAMRSRIVYPEELPGSTLKKEVIFGDNGEIYAIVNKIGSGTYGEVYKGINLDTGETVAVKMQMPGYEASVDYQKAIQEVKSMRDINRLQSSLMSKKYGENVIITIDKLAGTHDYDKVINSFGSNPSNDLQIKQMDMAFKFLEQIQALHNQGYIHGDIKPENMRWDENTQEATLIDFGLAMSFSEALKETDIVGTPPYEAPEVEFNHNQKYTINSDVFACGVSLIYLFTGRKFDYRLTPWEMAETKEAKIKAIKNLATDWYDQNGNVKVTTSPLREIATIVNQMIHVEPANRGQLDVHMAAIKQIMDKMVYQQFNQLLAKTTAEGKPVKIAISRLFANNEMVINDILKMLNSPHETDKLLSRIDPPKSLFLLMARIAKTNNQAELFRVINLVKPYFDIDNHPDYRELLRKMIERAPVPDTAPSVIQTAKDLHDQASLEHMAQVSQPQAEQTQLPPKDDKKSKIGKSK